MGSERSLVGLTFRLLNVQTGAVHRSSVPASNYRLLRFKRDVFDRSPLGSFFINRKTSGGIEGTTGERDYNRVNGAIAHFVFYRYLDISDLVGKSETPGLHGDNLASWGGLSWLSDFVDAGITWLTADKNCRDDPGYVPRKNQRHCLRPVRVAAPAGK